jgi:hypothetical protein
MKRAVAALALVAATLPAWAAPDWAFSFALSSDTKATFFDLNSVKKVGDIVTFWTDVYNKVPDKGIKHMVVRTRVNCSEQTAVVLSYVAYLQNGDNKTRENDSERMQALVPGSVGEQQADLVCNKTFPGAVEPKKLRRIGSKSPEETSAAWFSIVEETNKSE